jgi:tripartite-type tricarboxylate transporter receptor subunit TctC
VIIKVTRQIFFGVFLAAASCALAQAQSFPSQPVKIVVPYSAGGSSDLMARAVADGLSKIYKQPVIVENMPGAGGHIGAEFVVKAPADGHTLMLATISHNGAFKMYKRLRYSPATDLQPIALIAESFNVLMVRESLPVKSVSDLIALARAQPGKLTYASAGSGSATHMAAELFKYMTKTDILGIPFKGGAPAQVALLGGHVDINFETGSTAAQAMRSGKVRALAITSATRSSFFPDLPAVAESGVPGYAAVPWYTVSTSKGVPADIVHKLNADINAVLKTPELLKRWETLGLLPLGGSPEDAVRRNQAEIKRWEAVIDAAKIQVD